MIHETETLRLGIAFISHDLSARRNRETGLRNQLARAIATLKGIEIAKWTSIIWQPDLYRVKHKQYFQLLVFRIRASREWGNRSWLNAIKQILVFEFQTTLKGRSQLSISQEHLFVVEILTEKHVRAWTSALDDSIDVLLVLEDDAILEDHATPVLSQAFGYIRHSAPTFINLSKGNSLAGYAKEYIVENPNENWFKLKAADTACAYMVNRAGLKLLAEHYLKRSETAVIGADFVITDALLRNSEFEVLHSESPPFTNGTLFGVFESQTGSLPQNMIVNDGEK